MTHQSSIWTDPEIKARTPNTCKETRRQSVRVCARRQCSLSQGLTLPRTGLNTQGISVGYGRPNSF